MHDLIYRFIVGGAVVSFFAILGDALKPKSFAGLFGAAPSVALATLSLTVSANGKSIAAIVWRTAPQRRASGLPDLWRKS